MLELARIVLRYVIGPLLAVYFAPEFVDEIQNNPDVAVVVGLALGGLVETLWLMTKKWQIKAWWRRLWESSNSPES